MKYNRKHWGKTVTLALAVCLFLTTYHMDVRAAEASERETKKPKIQLILPKVNSECGKSYEFYMEEIERDITRTGKLLQQDTLTYQYEILGDTQKPTEDMEPLPIVFTDISVIRDGEDVSDEYQITGIEGKLNLSKGTGNKFEIVDTIKEYDGNRHPITVSQSPISFSDQFYRVKDQSGNILEDWTAATTPVFTEVGTYYFEAYATHDSYQDSPVSRATLIIKPREALITVDHVSKRQGEDDPEFTGSVSPQLVREGDLGQIAYLRKPGFETAEKGSLPITAVFQDNPNYKVSVKEGQLDILADSYPITIEYRYHEGEAGDPSLLPPVWRADLRYGEVYSVTSEPVSGYIADKSLVEGSMPEGPVAEQVIYHWDQNGNGLPDCEEQNPPDDDTPDHPGGSGGSGSRPSGGGSDNGTGPGYVQDVILEPEEIPLAPLPDLAEQEKDMDTVTIEETPPPLANLPKTGERNDVLLSLLLLGSAAGFLTVLWRGKRL